MTDKPPRFTSKRTLLALRCPSGRDFVEVWHESVPGFGARIMAATRDGEVRRTYLCRYDERVPDGQGGFKDKNRKLALGLVEPVGDEPAISFDEAMEQVLAKRRVQREQRAAGGTARLTVADAWARYGVEKALNRPATHEKDTKTYERHLRHLGDRFLDELGYDFWTGFLVSLRGGTLKVGDEQRGPLSNSSLLAIFNVASNLYEIGHKFKGLRGFAPRENPAKEAKRLIGIANKRKTRIPLAQLGLAWQASDQLICPWWRDLFRVFVLTGLRRSLLFSMRFDEVGWEQGVLLIDPRKRGTKRRGKDTEARPEPIRLPLSAEVMRVLTERRRFAPDQQGPVWFAPVHTRGKKAEGGLLTEPRSAWAAIEQRIGRHFTPHDLRRTFASLGLVATDGSGVLAVALLMLHTGSTLGQAVGLPAITVEYMNTDEAQAKMRAATEAISAYALRLAREGTEQDDPELPTELEAALKDE